MSRRFRSSASLLALALLSLSLGACATSRSHQSTSVVGYLYPQDRVVAVDSTAIPVLRLPLRVGIAFVPPTSRTTKNGDLSWTAENDIPETERVRLMNRVVENFRRQAIIKSVEVIPTAYLTAGGSFTNLEQLRSMFGIDVMVLLAYDQVQFNSQDAASLTYWTLVGAYLVEGEKNDTRTLIDAAVVDIASRRVLFRAPGTSVVKGRATPVSHEQVQRSHRLEGFNTAAEQLVGNLDVALEQFKQRVKEAPEDVKVVRTAEFDRRAAAGGAGAGAVDRSLLLLLGVAASLAMLAGGLFRRNRR